MRFLSMLFDVVIMVCCCDALYFVLNTGVKVSTIFSASFLLVSAKHASRSFKNAAGCVLKLFMLCENAMPVKTVKIKIYNLLGDEVLLENIHHDFKKEINLQSIANGIYFVKVFDGDKSYCKKLIIEQN